MSSSTGQITSLSTPGVAVKAVKESNYTASISSIGSNVLRSKTADFERMSDSNKKSRISAATMNMPTHNVQSLQAKIQSPQQQTAPITTNISISLKTSNASKKKSEDVTSPSSTTTTTSSSSGSSEKRQPIYKRQEIISSVQRTVKK
jgi:hypothetical protein